MITKLVTILVILLNFLTTIVLCRNIFNINSNDSNNNHNDNNDEYKLIINNDNINLLSIIKYDKIYFELLLKGHGFIGLGYTDNKQIIPYENIDLCLGYINDENDGILQDFHLTPDQDLEIDVKQNCELIKFVQNRTHTLLKFSRKLDTKDLGEDYLMKESSSVHIFVLYSTKHQKQESLKYKSLPKFNELSKFHENVNLINLKNYFNMNDKIKIIDLKNQDVELPLGDDDTIYWCKIFNINSVLLEENHNGYTSGNGYGGVNGNDNHSSNDDDDDDLSLRKQHIIRFEPLFDSNQTSPQFIRHINLYECQGSEKDLEELARERHGRVCIDSKMETFSCNQIIVSWVNGSEGFSLPQDVGIPVDPKQVKFLMMETHYTDLNYIDSVDPSLMYNETPNTMVDSSGLRLYTTTNLRKHDAGLLSVGIESNWRHIIPPGQTDVFSVGHCIKDCTKRAFPETGLNIIGVMMRTNFIGKEVKFKIVRKNIEYELMKIGNETLRHRQEFELLNRNVVTYPGDHLSVDCTYDSSSRESITLGGTTVKGEICQAITLYYPKITELTSCNSLTSLGTVLHSLGIEELALASNPVIIIAPAELAGQTLESRLRTYDWSNNFNLFQQITNRGPFMPLCWNSNSNLIPGTENIEGYSPNVTSTVKYYGSHMHHSNHNRLQKISNSNLNNNYNSSDNFSNSNNNNNNNVKFTVYTSTLDSLIVNDYDSVNSNSNSNLNNNNNNNNNNNFIKTKVSRNSIPETMSYSNSNKLRLNYKILPFHILLLIKLIFIL